MEEPKLKKPRIEEGDDHAAGKVIQPAPKSDSNLPGELADADIEKTETAIPHTKKKRSVVHKQTVDLESEYARYSEGLIDLEELKNIVMDSKIDSHSSEENENVQGSCPMKTRISPGTSDASSGEDDKDQPSPSAPRVYYNSNHSLKFIPLKNFKSQATVTEFRNDLIYPPTQINSQSVQKVILTLKDDPNDGKNSDQDEQSNSGIVEGVSENKNDHIDLELNESDRINNKKNDSSLKKTKLETSSMNISEVKPKSNETGFLSVPQGDPKNAEEYDEHSDSSDKFMDMDEIQTRSIPNLKQTENSSHHTSDNVEDYLRQFDVLDDLEHHSNQDASDSEACSNDSEDSDVPDDEIEAMLEEGLPEEFKGKKSGRRSDMMYEQREKLILNEIGHNHFDMLPEGWLQVTHNSGMPLYLHKQSRVCTMGKPYFLGPGSVRKHNVPISAIPCLQYKRALKEREEEKERAKEQADLPCPLPNAKIETVQENRATNSVDGEALRSYCQSLFQFKNIKVMRFKSWSQRRKFTKSKRQRKTLERPTLPDGTKLITFPVTNKTSNSDSVKEEDQNRTPKHWIMNPSGKSYICILHEYVQHALKKQPTYKFKELENAATPYSAVVCINDMEYGSGFGSSKKQAKADAAKKTLEILIPQMRDKISGDTPPTDSSSPSSSQLIKTSLVSSDADLSFFDDISITDPRVADFCAKTTEPLPHAILVTCLQRNFGLGDMHIDYSVNTLKHQRNEFKMRVGKHEATVVCRNKKDGKQRAAQAILQLLHPHIQSWGSLLRLYGSRSVKSFKEKKQLEQEITLLQGRAALNQPNHAILEKLRHEMRKLSEQRQAVKPIGKFITLDLPSGSAANLDNVDL